VNGTRVAPVDDAAGWEAFRALVLEYSASLGFDLDFQDFEGEVAHLDAHYAAPDGVALLAHVDGEPVGCVAVRRFDAADAELKRMWVQPRARGRGLGRALAAAAVDHARTRGYRRLLLDTIAEMTVAHHIYTRLGFREIDAYRPNPLASVRYLALEL
jgi:carbonic anhydrase